MISLRSTESDHVKTNLVHKLHRVQSFGIRKLEEFKDLLTPDQYSKCLKKSGKGTWYTLTLEVFTQFLYKVGNLIHAKLCYSRCFANFFKLILYFCLCSVR